jgi:hypothetical protein
MKASHRAARRMLKLNSSAMERAGKSLAKMKLGESVTPEELACAAWQAVVGKRLVSHAWAKALVRGNLVVEVEDAIWQKQLFHLRLQILPRLCEILGNGIVKDLEFRIATPRRPPQPALSARASSPADEADGIEDPVLRRIYRQSREKASA